jgi:hypothetical protein
MTVRSALRQPLAKVAHGRMAEHTFRARRLAASLQGLPPATEASRSLQAEYTAHLGIDALTSSDAWKATSEKLTGLLTERATPAEGFDLLDGRSTQLHCSSIENWTLIEACPEIAQWGAAPAVVSVIHRYLGVPPVMTHVVARLDYGTAQQVGTRIWHLDTEDVRVVRMIVYLSDVSQTDGPFEYLDRRDTEQLSPDIRARAIRAKGDPLLDGELRQLVPEQRWRQAIGPAGSVFLADNARLLHHGKVHESTRLALFFTYTSRFPRYPVIPPVDERYGPIIRIPRGNGS